MTPKKLLILTVIIIILEVIVLIVFGGFGPDAEEEGVVLKEIGFIRFFRHEMGLADFQNIERWNIDGTPEGETTFLSLNKVTTVMIIIIDCILIMCAILATSALKAVP